MYLQPCADLETLKMDVLCLATVRPETNATTKPDVKWDLANKIFMQEARSVEKDVR